MLLLLHGQLFWFEPSENVLIVPAAKEKTQIHFQGKDTDLFSSINAFKNNDALWTLQIQSDPYRRSLGFILPEKEILPT